MPIEGLNEELAANETISRYEDVNALAQGLIEGKATISRSIRIPSDDASDDDRSAFSAKLMEKAPNLMIKPDFTNPEQSKEFYRTLGMPNSADEYKSPEIQAPEGVKVNAEQIEAFKGIAHKHGLTAAQYQGVVSDFMKGQIDTASVGVDQHAAAMKALREEWGMAADDRTAAAVLAAKASGAPEGIITAIESGQADPNMIKWLHSVGEQIGDETTNFARKQTLEGSMTPAEAQMQRSEIMNNTAHPYNNPMDPGNKAAVKAMVKLNHYISGEKFDEKAFDKSMG